MRITEQRKETLLIIDSFNDRSEVCKRSDILRSKGKNKDSRKDYANLCKHLKSMVKDNLLIIVKHERSGNTFDHWLTLKGIQYVNKNIREE